MLEGQAILNRPAGLHTLTLTRLLVALSDLVEEGHQPVTDLRVRFGSISWVVPDVVVVRKALLEANVQFVTATDLLLVVEILSPSTTAVDRGPSAACARRRASTAGSSSPATRGVTSSRSTSVAAGPLSRSVRTRPSQPKPEQPVPTTHPVACAQYEL